MRRQRRRSAGGVAFALLILFVAFTAALWGADAAIIQAARGHCFTRVADVTEAKVGLVLGTNPKMVGGYPNLYYEARLDAAAALFQAGKVRYLLVSGDNGTRGYDEPTAMRQDLVKRGVPADRIVCDYAGFRTLDSVIRANRVFGQSRFVIISQRFHNERALYIARNAGLDAWAFDAADPPLPSVLETKMWWRERFARLAAILDARVWQRKPRFFGPPVVIGQAIRTRMNQ